MVLTKLLLLSVALASASAGSILTKLPRFKPEPTCDALFLSKLSTGVDEHGNATSVGTSSSEERSRSTAAANVKDAPTAGAASRDTRVLQDAASGRLGVVKPVVDCESLLGVDLSHIAADGGTAVTSAAEATHEGHLYCLVGGSLSASTQGQVMLPVRTWTQRYMQVGGGEFALGATDMGGAMDGKVFANSPGRRRSFAYSAQHLTSLVGKTLVRAYYGQKPRYSYFNGCSDGGREGVMEALRYPTDFDGVLAGAPAMLFQFQNSLHHGWLAVSNIDGPMSDLPPMVRGPPPGPERREQGSPRREHGAPGNSGPPAIVTASKLPLLHAAVVRACDALDGLVDGLLSDPRLCKFDVRELLCATEAAAANEHRQCLTEPEVRTIHKFYNGPVDPVTGRHLTVGSAQFGSELAWEGVFVPRGPHQPVMSAHIALAALRFLIFEPNPPQTYSLNDLQFTEATVELLRARHPLLDATSPDLTAFKAAGGKLILWHGWSDEQISPRTTIAYHEALQKQMGGAQQVAEFERLYLLPGVQHCGHGDGMAAVDLVTPLLEWVEQGKAPHKILTSTELNDDLPPWVPKPATPAVTRSRPVFPYPSLAKYTGQGDANDAANYVEGTPLYTAKTFDWAGHTFFEPYAPRTE
ncbi:Tannase and feruloyl esterase [Phytophthora pseudosyringae]|uniref:feruloyl esterase n=1 Tax=Phytophthora pseudosyringae TaxID=221518 RepID=A0A8T1V669_9STRA|nr:Tannase and feruloyl esterase [Phytophthora pseudosyringae]